MAVMHSRVMLGGLPRVGRETSRRRCYISCQSSVQNAEPTSRPQALFLSPVWPERSSSAAGVRTSDLIDAFRDWGFGVAYSSPSKPNSHAKLLEGQGVRTFQCAPNREDDLADILREVDPAVCIFDRFYAEEAFSFRVRELAPRALRMLDMQDVHFLRAGRQELAARGATMRDVLRWRPTADSAECLRELASIHRSDLTLVCSPEELRLLVEHYGVPGHKLALAPFFAPRSPYAPGAAQRQPSPGFAARSHFMMIGNFKHPPNMDSVEWACREVWPLVRSALASSGGGAGPPPELHIYGSYAPGSAAQRLHRPKEGVHLKGFAPSLDIMLSYRVSLAPLRFGAGLKGKVVDSWWHGLPVCTTPIGAEGMRGRQAITVAGKAASPGSPPAPRGSNGGSGSSGTATVGAAGWAVDPAEDGYIWQLGPQQDGSRSRSGGSGSLPQQEGADPAEEGLAWQMGPEQLEGPSNPAASSGSISVAGSGHGGSSASNGSRGPRAEWGGLWEAQSAEQLAADAAHLYTDEQLWNDCQARGFELLEELYDRGRNLGIIRDTVSDVLSMLEQRRSIDFYGQLLWQQQFRATEFMSRWIELKERGRH